jgi:hypothetical protein
MMFFNRSGRDGDKTRVPVVRAAHGGAWSPRPWQEFRIVSPDAVYKGLGPIGICYCWGSRSNSWRRAQTREHFALSWSSPTLVRQRI